MLAQTRVSTPQHLQTVAPALDRYTQERLLEAASRDLHQNRALTRRQYFESRPERAQASWLMYWLRSK